MYIAIFIEEVIINLNKNTPTFACIYKKFPFNPYYTEIFRKNYIDVAFSTYKALLTVI